MKRKKPQPIPAQPPVPPPPQAEKPSLFSRADTLAETGAVSWIKVILYGILLFLAMTVQTGRAALILAAGAAVLCIGRAPLRRMRERFCLPVLGLALYALMNGLSATYSAFGDTSARELYKIMASVALTALLLIRYSKKDVRGLLWALAAVSAAVSLVCIDSAVPGDIFQSFESFTGRLGASYDFIYDRQMDAARLNGIYNDSNISGSIGGLGAMAAIYLAQTGDKFWKRLIAFTLAGFSAVGLVLSVSRGAMICFGLALVVWLIAAGRGNRLGLFFAIFFSAGIAAAMAALSMPVIGVDVNRPLVLSLAAGPLAFVQDQAVRMLILPWFGPAVDRHRKLGLVLVACFAVLGAAAVTTAMNTMEPFSFGPEGGYFTRSLSLDPGEYTVTGDWDVKEGASLVIYSRTQEQVLLSQSTTLYSGPMTEEPIPFTVPEDAGQVRFYFRYNAVEGTVREAVLSDGTKLPMKYKLIPETIAGRIQGGMLYDNSFLLRMEFMKDAWKIFKLSPLLGSGLGSTEHLYPAVQNFFYASLYVHNYLLQALADMGILGFAGMLALLLGSAWLLLRRIWKERDPLAAMLLACWTMINAHGMMEFIFSIRASQCFSFALLILPVLLYAKPLEKLEKLAKWGGTALCIFFCAFFAVFDGLLEIHRTIDRRAQTFSTDNTADFMETLEAYIRWDVFSHEDYQLNYVAACAAVDNSRYNGNRQRYVEELRSSGTYTACDGLSRYYYLPRGEYEEAFSCSREAIAQRASMPEAWNKQMEYYQQDILAEMITDHMDEFVQGVLDFQDYLEEYNETHIKPITLTEENQTFITNIQDFFVYHRLPEGMDPSQLPAEAPPA